MRMNDYIGLGVLLLFAVAAFLGYQHFSEKQAKSMEKIEQLSRDIAWEKRRADSMSMQAKELRLENVALAANSDSTKKAADRVKAEVDLDRARGVTYNGAKTIIDTLTAQRDHYKALVERQDKVVESLETAYKAQGLQLQNTIMERDKLLEVKQQMERLVVMTDSRQQGYEKMLKRNKNGQVLAVLAGIGAFIVGMMIGTGLGG